MATLKRPRPEETWGIRLSPRCGQFFQETRTDVVACFNPPLVDVFAPAKTLDFRPSSTTLFVNGTRSRIEPTKRLSSLPVLKMVAGSIYLPKDDPSKPQGEDAHFVCLEAQTLGVADGVGGWSKRGIDAGVFAREIMMNAKNAALSEPKGNVDPKRVLQQACSNTRAQGGSTACIVTISGNVLRAANVGDSGFVIVRGGKVVYHSPTQQRYFNCPYQLGHPAGDNPSVAQELEVAVAAGDIVIAGTDGLFDNMDDFEIEETVESRTERGAQPEELACDIANLALYNSFDKFADTPFARASRKAGKNYKGGKVDDITVIIAVIGASN